MLHRNTKDIVAAAIVSFPLKTFKSGTTFQEVLLTNQELLQNEEKIQSVINNSRVPSTTPMKDPNVVDVIQISILLADDKDASSWWIKASASITNYNQKFWYIGCNVCWRAIYAEHGQTFTCRNCSGQECVAEARCRFLIELVDPTGTITATIFGKSAEKIFGVDALKFMQFCDKDGNIDFASMGNLSTTRQFFFQVKRSINKGNQYTVLKVLEKLQEEHPEDASKIESVKSEDEIEASTSISIQPNDGAKAPIITNT
ncbi:Replication protein A 70 kDa DNA-binding subunit B [Bienertia sinuspersici]